MMFIAALSPTYTRDVPDNADYVVVPMTSREATVLLRKNICYIAI